MLKLSLVTNLCRHQACAQVIAAPHASATKQQLVTKCLLAHVRRQSHQANAVKQGPLAKCHQAHVICQRHQAMAFSKMYLAYSHQHTKVRLN